MLEYIPVRKLEHIITQLKQPYHLAQGVLAYLLFGFSRKPLHIVGVTGTDGKTTTSTLIYQILKRAGKKVALISTVAAYLGNEEIDTGFHVTSPSPFALQRLLKRIRGLEYDFVVLEATSHGIYQHRLFGIKPEVAVLTNITHEHLDYHPSYEEYLAVKASFLARAKVAVINKTDTSYKKVHAYLQVRHVKVVEYDLKKAEPNLRTQILQHVSEPYNRENALAAATACLQLHISLNDCIQTIVSFRGVKGRMEQIPNATGVTAIVDFAHTPNALMRALEALRPRVKNGGKLIAVFGCAGLRDYRKRPMMGKIASELADEAVFTAEDPRIEDVNVIIRQMKEGVVKNHGHMHEVADRREAIQFAIIKLAKPGDVVGVFGKGHEKSMNLDGKHEIPWSDQEEVAKAFSLMK